MQLCTCFGWGFREQAAAGETFSELPLPSPAAATAQPTPTTAPALQTSSMPDTEMPGGQLDLGQTAERKEDQDLCMGAERDETPIHKHLTLSIDEDALAPQPATPSRNKKGRSATKTVRRKSMEAPACNPQDVPPNDLEAQPSGRTPPSGSTTSKASPSSSHQLSGFVLATLAAQQAHALASMEVQEAAQHSAQRQPSLGPAPGGISVRSVFASSASSTLNIDPQLAARWAALGKPRASNAGPGLQHRSSGPGPCLSPTGVLQPTSSGPGPCLSPSGALRLRPSGPRNSPTGVLQFRASGSGPFPSAFYAWDGTLRPAISLNSDRSTGGETYQQLLSERGTQETSVLSTGGGRMRMVQHLSDHLRSSSSSPPVSRALDAMPQAPAPGAPTPLQPASRQLPASRSMPSRHQAEMLVDAALQAALSAGPGAAAAAAGPQLRSRLSVEAGSSRDAGAVHPSPLTAQSPDVKRPGARQGS